MKIQIKSFWPGIMLLIGATIAFFIPGHELPHPKWLLEISIDKVVHIALFALLVVVWGLPFQHRVLKAKKNNHILIWLVLLFIFYGVIIEFIQENFIEGRTFGVDDMVADGLGCVVGYFVVRRQLNTVKKICFYGPESTGKSTMAKHMAVLFNTEFVPEVARELITSNNFTVEDIVHIGHAQTQRILEKTKTANKFLFCDTDIITTQIYSRHYLGVVPPVLYELEKQVTFDYYFLFDIDVPWVADGLRDLDNQDVRRKMFHAFKDELDKRGLAYVIVAGDWNKREQLIRDEISRFFK